MGSRNGELYPLFKARLCCGAAHTIVCDDYGRGWTCGSSRFGQLGNARERSQLEFSIISDGTDNDGEDSLTGRRLAMVCDEGGAPEGPTSRPWTLLRC